MGYIGFIFGLNFTNTINKTIQESTQEVYQEAKSEQENNIKNEANARINFTVKIGSTAVVDCGNFEVNGDAKAKAHTILAVTKMDNIEFDSTLFAQLKTNIENEIEQEIEANPVPWASVGDKNIANTITDVLDSNEQKITQMISNQLKNDFEASATSENNMIIEINGKLSGNNCILNGTSVTESTASIISEQLTDILLSASGMAELDTEVTTKVTQKSGAMSWWYALFIIGPIMGVGGASKNYLLGAFIFFLLAISLGVALYFIDTRLCKNDDEDEPVVKEECEDKSKKDKDKNDCLECKDGSTIVKKPFSNTMFIIFTISCGVSLLLCFILIALYMANPGESPSLNHISPAAAQPVAQRVEPVAAQHVAQPAARGSIQGGSKEFKKIKKFLNNLFK